MKVLLMIIKSIFIFLGSLILLIVGMFILSLYNPLKNVSQEVEKLPVFVSYNIVYVGADEYNLRILCGGNDIGEAFCVHDGKIFFEYNSYDIKAGTSDWYIASVDMETEEVQMYGVLVDSKDSYDRYSRLNEEYKKRSGFYIDGKIVLNNNQEVLEYDIVSQRKQKYSVEEYAFPSCEVSGEALDNITMQININGEAKIWDLETMSEKSPGIRKIYSYKTKKPYLDRFFWDCSFQYVDDKMYLVGNFLNHDGSSIAVILEYDSECDTWQYSNSHFTWDTCHERFYIIPEC